MYSDSISLRTNFGINFLLRSISDTRCIRPSSSRLIAAACSSAESSWEMYLKGALIDFMTARKITKLYLILKIMELESNKL